MYCSLLGWLGLFRDFRGIKWVVCRNDLEWFLDVILVVCCGDMGSVTGVLSVVDRKDLGS